MTNLTATHNVMCQVWWTFKVSVFIELTCSCAVSKQAQLDVSFQKHLEMTKSDPPRHLES